MRTRGRGSDFSHFGAYALIESPLCFWPGSKKLHFIMYYVARDSQNKRLLDACQKYNRKTHLISHELDDMICVKLWCQRSSCVWIPMSFRLVTRLSVMFRQEAVIVFTRCFVNLLKVK